MSGYWKTLLREVLDDTFKYSDIIHTLYCIITDYHKDGVDTICSESTLDKLRRSICESDPEWALTEIKDTKRCVRCSGVFLKDDLNEICYKGQLARKAIRAIACEECYRRIYDMGLYASDTDTDTETEESESESDTDYEEEYLSRAEIEDDIRQGR